MVPATMRHRMLELIHQSHLGMVKSKQKAREVLYWPGMSAEVEDMVRKCSKCVPKQTAETTTTANSNSRTAF